MNGLECEGTYRKAMDLAMSDTISHERINEDLVGLMACREFLNGFIAEATSGVHSSVTGQGILSHGKT